MALRQCEECGNLFRPEIRKCPNCGTRNKKKGHLPLYGLLLGLFLIGLAGFQLFIFSQEKPNADGSAVMDFSMDELIKTTIEPFPIELEQNYHRILASYRKNDFDQASTYLDAFKKEYGEAPYKDLRLIEQKIRVHQLWAVAKTLPMNRYSENLKIYRELLSLMPENSEFKRKVHFYRSRVNDLAQKEKEKRNSQMGKAAGADQGYTEILGDAPF
jgi:hypothetical protein